MVETSAQHMTMVETSAQHMRALEIANQVRLARSRLKRQVAVGEVDVAEVITACPWEAHTMEIAELLRSQRRWGGTRCRKFLDSIPMSEVKTIGSMTERQRDRLVSRLRAPGGPEEIDAPPLWPAWAA